MTIFNFLKKTINSKTDIAIFKGKSNNELVAKIHKAFNMEVDRLLVEAVILKALPEIDDKLLSKADRLRVLGFNNTVEIKEARSQLRKLNEVERENEAKNNLKDAIKYFSNKYPLYKFITEESVIKICKKYNLIFGDIDRYIGNIPDKKLIDIENFKINEEYELWQEEYISYLGHKNIEYIDKEKHEIRNKDQRYHGNRPYKYSKANMKIIAPLKDFNTEIMSVLNFKSNNKKIKIFDPIVLYPVFHKGIKYYLVITA